MTDVATHQDEQVAAPPAASASAVSVAEAVGVGLIALLGLLEGLAYARVFADAPLVRISVGAVLGAVVVGELMGRVGGRSWSTTVLASLGAAVVLAGPVVGSGPPTPVSIVATVGRLLDAPARILSHPLPVDADPAEVVLVFAVVWVAVALALELGRRTPDPFAPLLPLVVGVSVPVLLGAGGPPAGRGAMGVALAAAGALALSRAVRRPGLVASARTLAEQRRRRLTFGIPILVAAAVVAPAVGPSLPGLAGRDRFDARRTPPVPPVRIDSPLAKVDALAADQQSVTAFTAQGPPGVTRWPLAVLDRYDGVAWNAGGSLVPVSERFPPAISGAIVGSPATFDVEVQDTGTPFLPVPGAVVRLEGPDVAADLRTGTVTLADPSDDPVRYRVTAIVPMVTEAQLAAAVRPRTKPEALRPALPDNDDIDLLQRQAQLQIGRDLRDTTRSIDMRQLRALERFLSDPMVFAVTDEPVGGESLAGLVRLVVGNGSAPASADEAELRQGSVRQFAAAFAVLARTAGFSSRVVVGYRATGTGTTTERARNQITAWPEVRLAGIGWQAFDPVPDIDQKPEANAPDPADAPPDAGTTPVSPASTRPDAGRDRSRATEGGSSSGGRSGFAAVVLVALLGALLLRRPIRRRLRRRGDARQQVLGAWAEVLDLLRRAGVRSGSSRTVGEIRADAAGSLAEGGRVALADLGAIVTRVNWSPSPVVAGDPTVAWAAVAAVRDGLDRRSPWPRRRLPALGERSPVSGDGVVGTFDATPAPGPSRSRS